MYTQRIVSWRISRTMQTDFVRDALEQALYERQPVANALVHHSDRGAQYLSIRYSERLAETGIQASVGSKGDGYDNALKEAINGLFVAELIHRRAPWKTGNQWNWPLCNGCTGSTTPDFCSRLGAFLRLKLRQLLEATRQQQYLDRGVNLNQPASLKVRAVHLQLIMQALLHKSTPISC